MRGADAARVMPASYTVVTHSTEETEVLGATLAACLAPGDVVLLTGPLGAGKTALVRGAAQALQVAARVRSPTFVFLHEYPGPVPVLHGDLYRIEPGEGGDLGLEYLTAGDAISFVEWAERSRERFAADALEITITMGEADDDRVLLFTATHGRGATVLAAVRARRQVTAC